MSDAPQHSQDHHKRWLRRPDVPTSLIIKLYEQCKSLTAVAREVGMVEGSVYDRLQSIGYDYHRQRNRLKKPHITTELLIQMYEKHGSYDAVGRLAGLSAGSVFNRLVNAGYNVSRRHKDSVGKPPADITDREVKRLFEVHGNRRVVADILGCTSNAVSYRLRKLGIRNEEYKRWSLKDLQILQDEYPQHAANGTVQELADKLGRMRIRVSARANRLGLGRKENIGVGWKKYQLSLGYGRYSSEQVLRLYEKFHTYAAVAHEIGLSYAAVGKHVRKALASSIAEGRVADSGNMGVLQKGMSYESDAEGLNGVVVVGGSGLSGSEGLGDPFRGDEMDREPDAVPVGYSASTVTAGGSGR